MKTFLKTITLLGLFVSLFCLTSCGDDNGNNNNDTDFAATIAGTYLGEDNASDITKKEVHTKAIGATAVITRTKKNTIDVTYFNDGVTKGEGEAAEYQSMKVTKEGNTYGFSGYLKEGPITQEIKGVVDGNNLMLQVEISGLLITNFNGNKVGN